MSAVPTIPASVVTLDQLDAWIDANAASCEHAPTPWNRHAARMRMAVAVMDRAGEIGARMRAAEAGA